MPHTTDLHLHLKDLVNGSSEARENLIEHSCERLRRLSSQMLKRFPYVQRWLETDDVLQASLLRLHRALAAVHPTTPPEFYGLAATQIRRELLDLAKRFNGPHGVGANHHSDSGPMVNGQRSLNAEPGDLEAWARFHEAVDSLPDEQRKVVELLWYEGFSQPEAAVLLEVSLATVKRRWASARLILCETLEEWIMD